MTNIPEAVRTRVALHLATAEHDLSLLVDRLMVLPSISAEGRRLRARRAQLEAQRDAWSYLHIELTGGETGVPDMR